MMPARGAGGRGFKSHWPHSNLVTLLGPILLCKSELQINYDNVADVVASGEHQNQSLSPYSMFKYSIRSEVTQKYYERRLRKFFDFIKFELGLKEMEKRCNDFTEKGKSYVSVKY
jgi:hypothetical protein